MFFFILSLSTHTSIITRAYVFITGICRTQNAED